MSKLGAETGVLPLARKWPWFSLHSTRSCGGRSWGGPAAGERVLCPCSLSSLSSLIQLTAGEVGGLWETVSRRVKRIAMLTEA